MNDLESDEEKKQHNRSDISGMTDAYQEKLVQVKVLLEKEREEKAKLTRRLTITQEKFQMDQERMFQEAEFKLLRGLKILKMDTPNKLAGFLSTEDDIYQTISAYDFGDQLAIKFSLSPFEIKLFFSKTGIDKIETGNMIEYCELLLTKVGQIQVADEKDIDKLFNRVD